MNKKTIMIFSIILIACALFYVKIHPNSNHVNIPSSISPAKVEMQSNEENLISVFNKNTLSGKSRVHFFEQLDGIDWSRLNKIDSKTTFEILDWLYSTSDYSELEISSIMGAYRGLDGAMAETYSALIANIFAKNELDFVKILKTKSETNQIIVCTQIAYGCSYKNSESIIRITEGIMAKNPNTEEQILLNDIVQLIKKIEIQ
jgi:hypothetical protein